MAFRSGSPMLIAALWILDAFLASPDPSAACMTISRLFHLDRLFCSWEHSICFDSVHVLLHLTVNSRRCEPIPPSSSNSLVNFFCSWQVQNTCHNIQPKSIETQPFSIMAPNSLEMIIIIVHMIFFLVNFWFDWAWLTINPLITLPWSFRTMAIGWLYWMAHSCLMSALRPFRWVVCVFAVQFSIEFN